MGQRSSPAEGVRNPESSSSEAKFPSYCRSSNSFRALWPFLPSANILSLTHEPLAICTKRGRRKRLHDSCVHVRKFPDSPNWNIPELRNPNPPRWRCLHCRGGNSELPSGLLDRPMAGAYEVEEVPVDNVDCVVPCWLNGSRFRVVLDADW